MGDLVVTREMLAAKFGSILPHLDERQRRLVLGAEARVLGHGGIRLVAAAAGVREGPGPGRGPKAADRARPGPGPGAAGPGRAGGAGRSDVGAAVDRQVGPDAGRRA